VSELQNRAAEDEDILEIIGGALQTQLIESVVRQALTGSIFFKNSGKDFIDALCGCALCVRLKPGELVVHENSQANGLWIVVAGKLQLVQGENVEPLSDRNSLIPQGSYFGEWSLVEDSPIESLLTPCGAQCVTHCDFVHLPRDAFLKLVDQFPTNHAEATKRIVKSPHKKLHVTCVRCKANGHWAVDCHVNAANCRNSINTATSSRSRSNRSTLDNASAVATRELNDGKVIADRESQDVIVATSTRSTTPDTVSAVATRDLNDGKVIIV
jgi:hypothetical protein